jgi:purine-binding chemotaxis protein CheW
MDAAEAPIEQPAHAPDTAPWAFFSCGDQGYAVRLDRVHEIVPPQPVTRVPGCGPEVHGLLGLRGRVITVFDFGVISGGDASAEQSDHRLVLLRHGERVVGLAVDRMLTITTFEVVEEHAAGADGRAGGDAAALTAGGRVFTVLDPDTVFGPRLA